MTKLEKVISTGYGIFAMCLTAFVVLLFGVIFSVEYESNCTTNEATGKVLCTTRSAWKGWSGIPIEPLAGAIGTAVGAYALFLKTRNGQNHGDSDSPNP